jgi:hypothetical protein
MNKHLRVLAALLALAAIGGLVGIGTHVHAHDADHSDCWLCISSVAAVAVPAIAGLLLLYWVFIACIVAAGSNPYSICSTLYLFPRAPPVRLPI